MFVFMNAFILEIQRWERCYVLDVEFWDNVSELHAWAASSDLIIFHWLIKARWLTQCIAVLNIQEQLELLKNIKKGHFHGVENMVSWAAQMHL